MEQKKEDAMEMGDQDVLTLSDFGMCNEIVCVLYKLLAEIHTQGIVVHRLRKGMVVSEANDPGGFTLHLKPSGSFHLNHTELSRLWQAN